LKVLGDEVRAARRELTEEENGRAASVSS